MVLEAFGHVLVCHKLQGGTRAPAARDPEAGREALAQVTARPCWQRLRALGAGSATPHSGHTAARRAAMSKALLTPCQRARAASVSPRWTLRDEPCHLSPALTVTTEGSGRVLTLWQQPAGLPCSWQSGEWHHSPAHRHARLVAGPADGAVRQGLAWEGRQRLPRRLPRTSVCRCPGLPRAGRVLKCACAAGAGLPGAPRRWTCAGGPSALARTLLITRKCCHLLCRVPGRPSFVVCG